MSVVEKIETQNKQKTQKTQQIQTQIHFEYADFVREAIKISKKVTLGKDHSKIGLLGICRGGLPLLTVVANFLGIKDVYTISVDSETNTVVNSNLGEKQYYIAFEDVVSSGATIRAVGDFLRHRHAELLEVYCIFRDTDVELCTGIDIYPQKYKLSSQWVYFPWEKGFYLD